MKTGIIGAGRVGCSLGKYFRSKNADLVGYYDTNAAAAEEAAAFTQTAGFDQVQQLVRESDILFITTPDSLLVPVWEEIKGMSHRNQIICHCSGALSSDSFSGSEHMEVSCCSIHPMLPFSNRFSSFEQLNNAFFTVEGQEHAVKVISELFRSFGKEGEISCGSEYFEQSGNCCFGYGIQSFGGMRIFEGRCGLCNGAACKKKYRKCYFKWLQQSTYRTN